MSSWELFPTSERKDRQTCDTPEGLVKGESAPDVDGQRAVEMAQSDRKL